MTVEVTNENRRPVTDDLDHTGKRDNRWIDPRPPQMIRFNRDTSTSGLRHNFVNRLLAVIGEDPGIRDSVDSTLPVPVDGAGGGDLR
jgi:hypothetical protein